MRIGDKAATGRIQSGINKNRSEMSNLQGQAASMKRITKPSDDPVGTMRVQSAKTDRSIGEQMLKNIHLAKTNIDASEQALADLSDLFIRAKELALSQANDAGSDENTRRTTAVEVNQIFNAIVNIANRKFGERFLFGGFQTTEGPFTSDGHYKGDNGEIRIEVNRGVYMPINLNGADVFLGGTERTDNPWEKSKNEEEKIDANGPVIRGPASVEDPTTADVRGKDNKLAEKMEEEPNAFARGVNVFDMLRILSTGLQTNDKAMVQNSLEPLDTALQQIVHARAKLGARSSNLQATTESIQKQNVDTKVLESNFEDADTFELFTDIRKAQTALDATLSTSGRMIQPSLLDFLK